MDWIDNHVSNDIGNWRFYKNMFNGVFNLSSIKKLIK